ncbi:MAG: PadR family transcriptional regulator [Gaiellaceae bacterium]
MGRIFKRGELKQAIVAVLATLGEAHGYAIMGALKERVGGGWKPSPGAIYPALLALVDAGVVEAREDGGTRVYRLTDAGRAESVAWSSLAQRSQSGEERLTVGSLLDRFAADSQLRRLVVGSGRRTRIDAILERAGAEIAATLSQGEGDG